MYSCKNGMKIVSISGAMLFNLSDIYIIILLVFTIQSINQMYIV